MIHGGLQAGLVAMAARINACLHVLVVIDRHDEKFPFLFINRFPVWSGQKSVRKIDGVPTAVYVLYGNKHSMLRLKSGRG